MFDPMWNPQVSVFGLPPMVFIVALALLGGLFGLAWIRRITHGDPEVQSFLATADRESGPGWIVILGLAVVGLLVIVGTTVLAVLVTVPAESLTDTLLIGGALLAGLAVLLAVRRLFYRFR